MADGIEGLFSDFPAPMPTSDAGTGFDNFRPMNLAPNEQFMPTQGGNNWASLLPAMIPAATGLLGYFTGQGGAGDKALKQYNQQIQGTQALGAGPAAAYKAGSYTPAQQAALDQYRAQRTAAYQQQLAQMGIPVGSAQADLNATVEREVLAMGQQMQQQNFQNAYQTAGLAQGGLGNYAMQQAYLDAQQRQQWAQFMAALGKLGTQVDWSSLLG